MPVLKLQDSGYYKLTPGNTKVADYDTNIKNNPESKPKLSKSEDIKEQAKKLAENSDGKFTDDHAKYVIATKAAQDRLKDVDDVSTERMKQEIDDIYENELGASNTGREVRGENWFTDTVGTIKNGINGFNNTVGTVLDGIFDTIVGTPAGWINEDFGKSVQEYFQPEDLAIVSDIALDTIISKIPYVGLPLVGLKNAIQQSDTIAEALTGRDNITQLDIDEMQRAGKTASSLASVGLPMIPAIGGVKKLSNLNKAKKEAQNIAREENVLDTMLGNPSQVKGFLPQATNAPTPGSIAGEALTEIPSDVKGFLPSPYRGSTPNKYNETLRRMNKIDPESYPMTSLGEDRIAALRKAYPEMIAADATKLPGRSKDTVNAIRKAYDVPDSKSKEILDDFLGGSNKDLRKASRERARQAWTVDAEKRNALDKEIDQLKIDRGKAKTKSEKKEIKDLIKEKKEQRKEFARRPINASREFWNGLFPESKADRLARKQEDLDALMKAIDMPALNVVDPSSNVAIRKLQKAQDYLARHPLVNRAVNTGRNGAMLLSMAAANEIGETGTDPWHALALSGQRLSQDPASAFMMLSPLGARATARKYAPNISGKRKSDMGYQAIRAGAVGDKLAQMSETTIPESYNEEEIFDRLKFALDRIENGNG